MRATAHRANAIAILSAQSRTNAKENNQKKEIFVIQFIFLNFMQPIAT
jgi:hypothetical protein